MHLSHIMASGMGGLRTAGDLVAWMQITQGMKINDAKAYVAGKLGIDVIDLTGGDQPIFNEDGTVATVCNGEIFNYPELRRELGGKER